MSKDKKKGNKASRLNRRQTVLFYLFMAPWIVGFLALTAWPLFYTAFLSFFSVNRTVLGWERVFIGIDNYHLALFRSPVFNTALLQFFIMQISYVPFIVVIAFLLALLLNRGIRFRGFFRAVFFLPVIVMSGPVMAHLIDAGRQTFGEDAQGVQVWGWMTNIVMHFSVYFADMLVFLYDNFVTVLWFTGIPIILFLSALQKIDGGILEAAKIDSASEWQILWLITIPILKPIILVSIILTIIQLSSYALNPMLPIIQDAMFNTVSGLGLASAFAWIYSMLVLVLIGISLLLFRSKDDTPPPDVKRRAMRWNER